MLFSGGIMRLAVAGAMGALTAGAGISGGAVGQAGRALSVQVGPDTLLSAALPQRPFVEPHLAADPRNPNHLVGGAMTSVQERARLIETRCVAVATFDGGRSWVSHQFDVPRCHDPWAAILDDGSAVFTALETTDAGAVPHLWLFRSPDGGRTWNEPPHSFGRAHDHGSLIVDRSGGRFHGALYVASTRVASDVEGRIRIRAFIARSMDGGRSFAQTTEHETSNLNSTTMTVAVLPDGSLLVPQSAHQRYVADQRDAVPLARTLHWAIRSSDGGERFGPLMLITDACAGRAGFPSLAVDLSNGPHRGRAYFVCHDGPRSGPYIVRSDDGGDRWSDPLHVPKTPPAEAEGRRQTSSIAVNRDGIIAVTWHDRGPDASSRCWEVFLAASGDGGQTFGDAHKISTQPSCPFAGVNGYAAESFPFGGHYSGLAAAADGTFHLLWADSRGPRYQLRTAPVKVTDTTP